MVAVVPDGDDLDIEALIAYCEDRVARFAVPRYVRIMSELPKTSASGSKSSASAKTASPPTPGQTA